MTKQSKNLIDIISKYKIKISDKEFDTKINILENIDYIEISIVNYAEMIILADNGFSYINKTLKNFSVY